MLLGKLAHPKFIEEQSSTLMLAKKKNIYNQPWEKWKREHFFNFQKSQRIKAQNSSQATIKIKITVLIHKNKRNYRFQKDKFEC